MVLYAGALDLGRSELITPPEEGSLRREKVRLSAGDIVRMPVYLLDGPAGLRVTPGLRDAKLTGFLDGIGPLPIEGGESVQLGEVERGWHVLTFIAPDDGGAVDLREIIIRTGAQTLAPDLIP